MCHDRNGRFEAGVGGSPACELPVLTDGVAAAGVSGVQLREKRQETVQERAWRQVEWLWLGVTLGGVHKLQGASCGGLGALAGFRRISVPYSAEYYLTTTTTSS